MPRCGTAEIVRWLDARKRGERVRSARIALGREIEYAELTTNGYAKTRRLAAVPFKQLASIRLAAFAIDAGEPTTWQNVVS